MNNKINKEDIIEGITFILMTVGVIGMLCLVYEVTELKKLTKDASNYRSITIKK